MSCVLIEGGKFEDTKRVIRSQTLKKDRQYSGQKKMTYTTLYHKTKDCATRIPLKTGVELKCAHAKVVHPVLDLSGV